MTLFARINHAEEARKVGLEMLPIELLVFGNHTDGTALMVERPTVGIDLPMKALAWEDQAGRVWLSFNAPSLLHARHGLPEELLLGSTRWGNSSSSQWSSPLAS